MMTGWEILPLNALGLMAVCVFSTVVGLVVAWMARGITIYGLDTLEQVRAAARAGDWRWPSDMHRSGSGRTRMKDAFVLGLAAVQRLLRDGTSGHPPVVLCLVANALSAVLIFLIGSAYWTPAVGLLLAALFLTSFWPYLNALYGGPICLAQTFFLASAYLMERAALGGAWQALAWYAASGAALGLMLFSSASSRKYLPLLAGAFVYSQRAALSPVWVEPSERLWTIAALATPVLGGLGFLFAWFRLRRVVRAFVGAAGLYVLACLTLSLAVPFYLSQLAVVFGLGVVVLVFTCPHVRSELRAFFDLWASGHKWGSHFPVYREYFARIGKPIRKDMRGAGIRWLVRYFWRIAPFHSAWYLLSLVTTLVANPGERSAVWSALGVVVLSLSPLMVGELTRSPQLGRTYFPGFAGLLLGIGDAVFRLSASLSPEATVAVWLLAATLVVAGAAWNLWVFLDDVWPARMAPAWLCQTLRNLGIRTFHTYDTPYTQTLFYVAWEEYLRAFDVRFIRTLEEVKEGYVVVPGTSAKAVNMECHPYAIRHGDFDEDPVLNRLIESGAIERYAVASFKTLGSSRMWGHESEVVSYQDLILGEISDYDRWRAKAWILDASKLPADGLDALHTKGMRPEKEQRVY